MKCERNFGIKAAHKQRRHQTNRYKRNSKQHERRHYESVILAACDIEKREAGNGIHVETKLIKARREERKKAYRRG